MGVSGELFQPFTKPKSCPKGKSLAQKEWHTTRIQDNELRLDGSITPSSRRYGKQGITIYYFI